MFDPQPMAAIRRVATLLNRVETHVLNGNTSKREPFFMSENLLSWNDLALFLAVAHEGGLSAASKTTGRSAATLGRRMLALERALGEDLFVRHNHGYELTDAGRGLLPELETIDTQLDRLFSGARRLRAPSVKVSAGTWTTLALLDDLDLLLGDPPDVRLQFVSTEAVLSISRREAVIGIRNERPADERLALRRLRPVHFAPYATDNAPARWIQSLVDTPSARWVRSLGAEPIVCEVSSPRNALDLALAGQGVAVLPTFIGDMKPTLKRRDEPIEALSHEQWIVIHPDDRELPEVRRTIDRLYQVLVV